MSFWIKVIIAAALGVLLVSYMGKQIDKALAAEEVPLEYESLKNIPE